MKKIFSEAFAKASEQLAEEMDRQLKDAAYKDGWPIDVVEGLSVDSSFKFSHSAEHSTVVFDMEFGNENSSPKGTVRKFGNDVKSLTGRFAHLYEKWVVKL